jgi:hypothetical protein
VSDRIVKWEFVMKKKRKKFSASKEARRRARLSAGSPPAARVIPDKRLKPPKHKLKIVDDVV